MLSRAFAFLFEKLRTAYLQALAAVDVLEARQEVSSAAAIA